MRTVRNFKLRPGEELVSNGHTRNGVLPLGIESECQLKFGAVSSLGHGACFLGLQALQASGVTRKVR